MSYARFGANSDVYVFFSVDGLLECCGCLLEREWGTDPRVGWDGFDSTRSMVDHLGRHIAARHVVPDYVIPALWADDAQNFPEGAS